MPNASEFLSGFGFIKNRQFAGYQLIASHSTHESIKRYQEYKYLITLTFKDISNANYQDFYITLSNQISQQHIIYGVKNPYFCIIDPLKSGDIFQDSDGNIIILLIGHSYRQ